MLIFIYLFMYLFLVADSEEEYEADEEDAQEVGYVSEPAVGLSDVSMLSFYTLHRKYATDVRSLNI
jgi:flagellar basal body rod protein FlgC